MRLEDMNKLLTQISSESFQTKVLNVILTQYKEIKQLETRVNELQQKVNEIISNWNTEIEGVGDAEALNNDIRENVLQEDIINKDTGSAAQEE